jgi:hypothetical protein
MVERAEREPTVEEIVVALRETERGAARVPPFTVVGGQPGDSRAQRAAPRGGEIGAARAHAEAGAVPDGRAGSTRIADLRDGEIARLLAENMRLNERVVFLLKVIEREQARNAEVAAEHAATETERSTIFRDVSAAIEAELRLVLLVVLRLIEKQRADTLVPAHGAPAPGGSAMAGALHAGHAAAQAAFEEASPGDAEGILDLDALHT